MRWGWLAAAIVVLTASLLGCQQPYRVFAVQIAKAAPATTAVEGARVAPPAAASGAVRPHRRKASRQQAWDLNRAPAAALMRLPGISRSEVTAMIAGRPYGSKRQLLKRGIFSAAQYAKWKGLLVVHRRSRKRQNANPA